MMKTCNNPTCSRPSTVAYCSRQCQLAMRTVNKGRQVPDLWVGMDTWWALTRAAEHRNVTIRDYVASLVEVELVDMGQLELAL